MSAPGRTPGPPRDAEEPPASPGAIDAAVLPADAAIATLARGPRGALVVSAIAVALLFIGWLLFYFCLFIPRGAIG